MASKIVRFKCAANVLLVRLLFWVMNKCHLDFHLFDAHYDYAKVFYYQSVLTFDNKDVDELPW